MTVCSLWAQKNDTWTAFWNEETELMGFRDSKGQIMIKPQFMGFTIAKKFDNIIAVMAGNNGEYETYYLTKTGQKVGFDSLHIYDNGADCESEGFIRFKDKKTGKTGLFDKNGNIAIPASYNELSRVHNGLIFALKDAKKAYWGRHNKPVCNHYTWKGGQKLLLSKENKVLIKNFNYEGRLDLYSLIIQNTPDADSTKANFKGLDGKYYIFTDIEKAFKQWLKTELVTGLTLNKLEALTIDSLIHWKKTKGWITEPKQTCLTENFELIKERLQSIQMDKTGYFISIDELNPFLYAGHNFYKYFNTCGEAKKEKYPVMRLIINKKTESDFTQDQFEFLKTDEGYRLIRLIIKDGETACQQPAKQVEHTTFNCILE